MKRFFSSVLLALAAAALPLSSHAAALDAPLTCNESGHQFIADLAQQQLIDPKPITRNLIGDLLARDLPML